MICNSEMFINMTFMLDVCMKSTNAIYQENNVGPFKGKQKFALHKNYQKIILLTKNSFKFQYLSWFVVTIISGWNILCRPANIL